MFQTCPTDDYDGLSNMIFIVGSKEDSSSWDEDGVDLLYRGVMPKWLDDGTEKHLKYYEVCDVSFYLISP